MRVLSVSLVKGRRGCNVRANAMGAADVKIDVGPVHDLDMETVEEAPSPEIYLGRRLRRADPPTTRRLVETLANLKPSDPD